MEVDESEAILMVSERRGLVRKNFEVPEEETGLGAVYISDPGTKPWRMRNHEQNHQEISNHTFITSLSPSILNKC